MQMRSSASWLFACLTAVGLTGLPTVAAADDWDACGKQSGDLAVAGCSRAIDSNQYTGRNLAWLYASRGVAYLAQSDLDHAMADFNEAIRLDPKDAAPYYNRGVACTAQGDLDRAIADFYEAIRLDPKDAASYSIRGIAWSDKGELDRAIADFDEAIRLDPKDAKAYSNRGIAYTNRGIPWPDKGDLNRAIADFDQAIRLTPKYDNPSA